MKNLPAIIVSTIFVITAAGCGTSDNNINDTGMDTSTTADIQIRDIIDDTDDAGDRDITADAFDDSGESNQDSDTTAEVLEDTGNDNNTLDVDDQGAATDTTGDTPHMSESLWKKMPVEIDDPVVNGNNVMTPVDGLSFAYDPTLGEYVTYFSHQWDDPSVSFVWHIDEEAWSHTKKQLSGEPFADETNFCMGEEDWCQFITRYNDNWIVFGPRTPTVMAIDDTYNATQSDAITGDQPPNGAISYSHLFFDATLYIYGYITASGFCDSLYTFDIKTNTWSVAVTGLPALYSNSLAISHGNGILYSVGGLTSDDGGESSQAYSNLLKIDVSENSFSVYSLPEDLQGRQAMSSAFDPKSSILYVFGGCTINDRWDERENVYHSDLWKWDGVNWTRLLPDENTGTFEQYNEDTWSFVGDAVFPNFGKHTGRMMFDGGVNPRLLLMGEVPGSATQIYALTLSDLDG